MIPYNENRAIDHPGRSIFAKRLRSDQRGFVFNDTGGDLSQMFLFGPVKRNLQMRNYWQLRWRY